jgi:hypothetical protein
LAETWLKLGWISLWLQFFGCVPSAVKSRQSTPEREEKEKEKEKKSRPPPHLEPRLN